jgi:hypothetical protein
MICILKIKFFNVENNIESLVQESKHNAHMWHESWQINLKFKPQDLEVVEIIWFEVQRL